MVRKETFKNADYPNRVPFYANARLYRAYNKLNTIMCSKFDRDTKDESHIFSVISGLKKSGNEVIRDTNAVGDVEIYFRKKRKLKGGKKNVKN